MALDDDDTDNVFNDYFLHNKDDDHDDYNDDNNDHYHDYSEPMS